MNIKKRLLALALAGIISTSFVGCKKNDKGANTNNDFLNHYDNYTQMDIVDESIINQYRGSNVVIAINKETNEVNEYIYFAGDANNYLYQGIDNAELLNGLGFIVELYDLETGELLYFNSEKNNKYNIGIANLKKILNENDFYNLYDLYDFGIEYKEWYTMDEIRDIAQIIVDRNNKIKKLTRN